MHANVSIGALAPSFAALLAATGAPAIASGRPMAVADRSVTKRPHDAAALGGLDAPFRAIAPEMRLARDIWMDRAPGQSPSIGSPHI